eukprot:4786758-Amphidinium_carterae.3
MPSPGASSSHTAQLCSEQTESDGRLRNYCIGLKRESKIVSEAALRVRVGEPCVACERSGSVNLFHIVFVIQHTVLVSV